MSEGWRSRLFLSSTKEDLAAFRDVVVHVCQRLGIDVHAMEDLPAYRDAAVPGESRALQLRDDLFVHLPRFRAAAPPSVAPQLPTIPAPPEPYIAHRYALLQTARVIGR